MRWNLHGDERRLGQSVSKHFRQEKKQLKMYDFYLGKSHFSFFPSSGLPSQIRLFCVTKSMLFNAQNQNNPFLCCNIHTGRTFMWRKDSPLLLTATGGRQITPIRRATNALFHVCLQKALPSCWNPHILLQLHCPLSPWHLAKGTASFKFLAPP